jgi:hypothetical protein
MPLWKSENYLELSKPRVLRIVSKLGATYFIFELIRNESVSRRKTIHVYRILFQTHIFSRKVEHFETRGHFKKGHSYSEQIYQITCLNGKNGQFWERWDCFREKWGDFQKGHRLSRKKVLYKSVFFYKSHVYFRNPRMLDVSIVISRLMCTSLKKGDFLESLCFFWESSQNYNDQG